MFPIHLELTPNDLPTKCNFNYRLVLCFNYSLVNQLSKTSSDYRNIQRKKILLIVKFFVFELLFYFFSRKQTVVVFGKLHFADTFNCPLRHSIVATFLLTFLQSLNS